MTEFPAMILRLPLAACALLLCAALSAAPALARDIYVAVDGWDNGDGSAAAPFRTINRAASETAPGDTVIVRPGVYYDTVAIRSGGTQDAPVVYRPETVGSVTIDGSETPDDTDLVQIAGNYVEWRGFSVENSTRSGISVWGTTGVTVADNQVVGSTRAGIWVGQTEAGQSSWNVVTDNIVFGNCIENVHRTWRSGWPRAIAVDLSDGTRLARNIVFQNYGEGIGILSSREANITENVVFDNFSVNIYLDNAPAAIVQANLVFTSGDRRFFRAHRPAYGVTIANEATEYVMPSEGITVTGNTLIGVGDVFYDHYGAGGGLKRSTIKPNAVDDTADVAGIEDQAHNLTNCQIHLPRPCGRVAMLGGSCNRIGD